MSSKLKKHAVVKSREQCRGRIKKLRQEYKKIKDYHNQTGRWRKNWKFYESLNNILGNKPATCPSVVLDTSDDTPAATEEDMSDKENTVIEDSSNELSSNEDGCEPGNTSAVQSGGGDSGSSGSSSSAIKGKRTKGEVVEQVVTKVMKKLQKG